MRKLLHSFVLAGAMMSVGALAQAQDAPPPAANRYAPEAVSNLVEKVHVDLNQGYQKWHLSGGDHDRLNKAEKRLREFAAGWRNAKFDKGALDDSISAIQHVLDTNHLEGQERDALWADVEQLRSMRQAYDHHEIGQ